MKTLERTGILVLAIALIFGGCRQRDDENFQATTNNAEALVIFDDINKVLDEAASGESDLNKVEEGAWNLQTASCAIVTLSPLGAAFPKTLTIDFGSGCSSLDGRYRKGQIVAKFSGPYRSVGDTIEVELENYEVDDYQVDGSKRIVNLGFNGAGNPEYSVEVSDVTITNDDGTATWESSRTRTWSEGSETGWFTPDTTQPSGIMGINGILDDVYHIAGTASGTTRANLAYDVVINEPLEVKVDCRWVKAGSLTISLENLNDRVIDYGNGDCDGTATIEVNGNTYNFTMN